MTLISRPSPNMNEMPLNDVFTYPQKEGNGAVPIVSFVGTSNSGKTTLLEKVVRELKSHGYRVGVIKHTHHDFSIDQPGKDTWRFAQAGCDVVAISSPNKTAFIEQVDTELTLAQIEAFFAGKVDIVLTEGYKNDNAAKILVMGNGQVPEQICREEDILATVSAQWSPLGIPKFDYGDVIGIVNILIERVGETSPCEFMDISTYS